MDKNKRIFLVHAVKEYLVITGGAILAACAIYFFMLPSHVAVGSGSALAMILSNFMPLPVSVLALLLNVFRLILGFLLIGPEFGAKTVYTCILLPAVLVFWKSFSPIFNHLHRIRFWMLPVTFFWWDWPWRSCFPAMHPQAVWILWRKS